MHIGGLLAIAQLMLGGEYNQSFYQTLNSSNATGILHESFHRVRDAVSALVPAGGALIGPGTLLQAVIYLASAVYLFYLARSVMAQCDRYAQSLLQRGAWPTCVNSCRLEFYRLVVQ
jgi:endo-1,4-beta-D-glucanase Y